MRRSKVQQMADHIRDLQRSARDARATQSILAQGGVAQVTTSGDALGCQLDQTVSGMVRSADVVR